MIGLWRRQTVCCIQPRRRTDEEESQRLGINLARGDNVVRLAPFSLLFVIMTRYRLAKALQARTWYAQPSFLVPLA